MTTAEALLAMKIGCRVIPATWTDSIYYYELQGNSICFVNKSLNFVSLVCAVNNFIIEFEGMKWRLYDDSTSISGNEAGM